MIFPTWAQTPSEAYFPEAVLMSQPGRLSEAVVDVILTVHQVIHIVHEHRKPEHLGHSPNLHE